MAPPPHSLADPLDEPEDSEVKPPPAHPLWQGVYTFPWQLDTLRIWILLGLSFGLVAFLATFGYSLWMKQGDQELAENQLLYMMTVAFTAVAIAVSAWISSSVGAFFLDAVQETANGHESPRWPENSFFDRVLKLSHLLLVIGCCLVPLAFLAVPLRGLLRQGIIGWIVLLLPLTFLFPLFLLSSLANHSAILLVHGKVFLYLLRKPKTACLLALMSVVLLLLAGLLGYLTIVHVNLLVPLTGFFWATCVLIYGRLLGRVAWLIAREDAPKERPGPRRKKRKKQGKKTAAADATGGTAGALE
jgi:hypothetical protein